MTIKKAHWCGFLFTIILGVLFHFVYEWSGENPVAAYFFPINESIWEHLKLLVLPYLLFIIAEYFTYGRMKCSFFLVKAVSLLAGMAVIISFFYTYSGILGKDYFIGDMITFILGVLTAYLLSYWFIQSDLLNTRYAFSAGFLIFIIIICAFFIFTKNPPAIGLFKDPVTGGYGLL